MADVSEEVPIKDATTAISQGKRHLLVRDYHLAVVVLAQACELLAQEHGETGDEMGELYLLYGRALLGLAREEAGVLGGGVPGSEEASQDEQGEEEEEEESEEGTAAESNSAAEDNSCIPNGKESEPIAKRENEDSEDTKAKEKIEKKAEEKAVEKAEEKAEGKAEADEKADEKPSKTIDNKIEKMNKEESKRIEEIPGCSRDFNLHNNEASSSKTKRQRKEADDDEADEEEEEEDVEGKENEEDDVNNLQVWIVLAGCLAGCRIASDVDAFE